MFNKIIDIQYENREYQSWKHMNIFIDDIHFKINEQRLEVLAETILWKDMAKYDASFRCKVVCCNFIKTIYKIKIN